MIFAVNAPGSQHQARDLLVADRLDRAELIGVGLGGQVRRSGRYAVKVAHPEPQARARLAAELQLLAKLQAARWPVVVPRLYLGDAARGVLVRDFIALPRLLDLLRACAGQLDPELIALFADARGAASAVGHRLGSALDFTPANLCVDRAGCRLVLVDTGPRAAPNRLLEVAPAALPGALAQYLRWRTRLERGAHLAPMVFPPSGRFAVAVPAGPLPGAPLLWTNQRLRRELGLPCSDAELLRQVNLSTAAPRCTTQALASRYQDAPDLGRGGAQGDGRSLYLGTLPGGPYGRLEVQLKGAGPTPLAWVGHRHHEDGWVSFPRTLWEVAIADELARLGFAAPQVLAVVGTRARTVDNTDRSWPAAMAVRVAATHFRVGHLRRWSHRRRDREALMALLQQVGSHVLGSRFDVASARWLVALAESFFCNLGGDLGRAGALNIRCFHPTLGNMRVDGHSLDFSTVRVFRHHLPDFRFLNNTWSVRKERELWLRHALAFVHVYRDAELLPEVDLHRLQRRARRLFDQHYDRGYLAGLSLFLGLDGGAWPALGVTQARALVARTVALRDLRGDGRVTFTYFGQSCPGPLFDLEDRSPDFVEHWLRRRREPWRTLLVDPTRTLAALERRVAGRWLAQLERSLGVQTRCALRPRRFHEVIRPFMEAEALSDLCYRRSTPRGFEEWQQRIATSRHLPPGDYDYFAARAQARLLGHLSFAGLQPLRAEVLVGMGRELYAAICAILQRELDGQLIGVIAHGSRVMTRARLREVDPRPFVRGSLVDDGAGLREHGPDPRKSSDLDLKVFVRPGLRPTERLRLGLALGGALARLDARFPISGRDPPRLRLIATRRDDPVAAFRAYNRGPRQRQQHRSPISEEQALVFLWPGQAWRDPDEPILDALLARAPADGLERVELSRLRAGRRAARDTGCGLSWHQLELCLRDRDDVEPPPPLVRATRRGHLLVVEGADAVEAARRAGRQSLAVRGPRS